MAAWTPALLGPATLRGWFRADAITGLSDGAAVASWSDSSGNSTNGTQATGANQPLYRTNQVNGLPAVQFVTSDSLNMALPGSSVTESVVAVVQRDALANLEQLVSSVVGGREWYIQTNNTLRLTASQSTVLGNTTGTIPITPTVIGMQMTPTTWLQSINGTAESGSHAVTFVPTTTTAIGEGPGSSNGLEGFIPEILFTQNLSLADFQRCEGYLAHKYALQANLPAAHPYKSAPPSVAGSWSPGLLGPRAWLQADKITGLSDSAAVASWTDSSGNGRHAVQATGVKQPIYRINAQNGLPVVRFDGTDDDIQIINTANIPPVASIFVAFKTPADAVTGQRVYNSSSNYHLFNCPGVTANGARMQQVSGTFDYSSSVVAANWEIHSQIFNTTTSRGSRNGTSASGSTGTAALTAVTLVISGNGGGFWADMDLGELIIIDGAVSVADEDKVIGYLAHKWGLTSVLPGGHPYKTVPPLNAVSVTAGVF